MTLRLDGYNMFSLRLSRREDLQGENHMESTGYLREICYRTFSYRLKSTWIDTICSLQEYLDVKIFMVRITWNLRDILGKSAIEPSVTGLSRIYNKKNYLSKTF